VSGIGDDGVGSINRWAEFGEFDKVGLGQQIAEKAGVITVHMSLAKGSDQLLGCLIQSRDAITSLDVGPHTIGDQGVMAF
jgi:hypothetical protein